MENIDHYVIRLHRLLLRAQNEVDRQRIMQKLKIAHAQHSLMFLHLLEGGQVFRQEYDELDLRSSASKLMLRNDAMDESTENADKLVFDPKMLDQKYQ